MNDDLLQAKEQELAHQVFEWAKDCGLADFIEQIRVSIRITKNASTDQLAEEDWNIILSDPYQWSEDEIAFLRQIKSSGNKPQPIPDTGNSKSYLFGQRIQVNFLRNPHPYFWSVERKSANIKKRLVSTRQTKSRTLTNRSS